MSQIIHGGLIARRIGGFWCGVLIDGPSGAGKSDLALRALERGFRLVADDRTLVFLSGGAVFGRAPDTLSGLIEVRGIGVLQEPALPFARICLCVTCENAPEAVERMPHQEAAEVLGAPLPRLRLWPFEPSAAAKLSRALEHLGERGQQAYLPSLAPPRRRVGA